MKLTKDCKTVLKILNKMNCENNLPCDFMNIIQEFPKNKQGKIALILPDILHELKENEYLIYLSADDTFFDIHLTYKGISYKEIYWLNFKEFCLKSIFLPILLAIISAIITTKITLWLTPPPAPIP